MVYIRGLHPGAYNQGGANNWNVIFVYIWKKRGLYQTERDLSVGFQLRYYDKNVLPEHLSLTSSM